MHRHGPNCGHVGPDGTWRPPLFWFIRWRLHRRLFMWFGASILFAAAVFIVANGIVAHLEGGSSWSREVDRMRTFTGAQFERVWDDPARRAELGTEIARDLDLDLRLKDPSGAPLGAFGRPLERVDFTVPVLRAGRSLGAIEIGASRHHGPPFGVVAPFAFAAFVLWLASGRVARRLTRPLVELARVAQDLGAGKLDSRARVGRHMDEVGIVAVSMNEMADRIQKQLADQRELLAAVSHELRTPLGHVRLLAELARTGAPDPKPLDELDKEVVELDALVGQLLAHSRLDFAVPTMTLLDGAELGRRALERSGQDPALLKVEAASTAFEGDATLISRALSNLIENAKKHAGAVDALRVSQREGFLAFEVDDHGKGFAPGDEARAFDAFFRRATGSDRDRETSLGLGLNLVKRTAEAHGGSVWALNRPEGGARVGFEIPIVSRASATEV